MFLQVIGSSVKVGDVLRVNDNESIPADLLLLYCSLPEQARPSYATPVTSQRQPYAYDLLRQVSSSSLA